MSLNIFDANGVFLLSFNNKGHLIRKYHKVCPISFDSIT